MKAAGYAWLKIATPLSPSGAFLATDCGSQSKQPGTVRSALLAGLAVLCIGAFASAWADPLVTGDAVTPLEVPSVFTADLAPPSEPVLVTAPLPVLEVPPPEEPIAALQTAVDTIAPAAKVEPEPVSRPLVTLRELASDVYEAAMTAENLNAPVAAVPAPLPVSLNSSYATPEAGDAVARIAALYATFQADVSEISGAPFSSLDELDRAVDQFGGQNPRALASGWIAYAAMSAAGSPEFRASVLDVDSHYGRQTVLSGLRNDVSWARRELKGSQAALDAALAAIDADARRLADAAERVRLQGYTLQKSPWALKATNDGETRVSALKLASLAGRPIRSAALALLQGPQIEGQLADAGRAGAKSLWDGAAGAFGSAVQFASLSTPTFFMPEPPRLNPLRSNTADRILTMAAYRVLQEQADSSGHISLASADADAVACQERANLMFMSCVRSNKFRYERPVCISQHVIGDVGKCMAQVLQ